MSGIFEEWYRNRHDYARRWKVKKGGKVVGYFCTYVPEEIFYALGILPVRILGSHEPQDVTEPHIFAMFCPFCRDCLAQGLKGRYDYLDGITIAQSCLHIRQAFNSWQKHIPLPFSYYLPMPCKVRTKRAYPFLKGEYEDLIKKLEEWTGLKMEEERLIHAIKVYNTNRELLHRIYELRKEDEPSISGREAMLMVVSSQFVDKEEHNIHLEETLHKLSEGKGEKKKGIRLMLIGSENDDIEFVEMVENVGGNIVTDDHCTGTRYFWNSTSISDDGDLIMSLATRYLERPPCPSKDWEERMRLPHILELAKGANVQGAILIQQKFCDPHELDIPAIKSLLESNNIPTLFLEFDVTVPIGQLRIRVEAFLEMLSSEDLF